MGEVAKEFVIRVPRRLVYKSLRSNASVSRFMQLTSDSRVLGIKPAPPVIVEEVDGARVVAEYRMAGTTMRLESNLTDSGNDTIVNIRSRAGIFLGKTGAKALMMQAIQNLVAYEEGYLAGQGKR